MTQPNVQQLVEQKFKRLAQAEFNLATTELAKLPPQEALIRFYRRHDVIVDSATATTSTKVACRSGCSYCCYYKVEALAIEVLAIQQFVINRFSPEQIRQIMEQANRNVDDTKGLSYKEQLAINQRCPFLLNDQCSVYSIRPSKCRNFHSTNVQTCKDSYEQPKNLDIPTSYDAEVFVAGNGTATGFEEAAKSAGYDPRVYDLNSAFIEAMQNPKIGKRLKSGKKAFLSAIIVSESEQDKST